MKDDEYYAGLLHSSNRYELQKRLVFCTSLMFSAKTRAASDHYSRLRSEYLELLGIKGSIRHMGPITKGRH